MSRPCGYTLGMCANIYRKLRRPSFSVRTFGAISLSLARSVQGVEDRGSTRVRALFPLRGARCAKHGSCWSRDHGEKTCKPAPRTAWAKTLSSERDCLNRRDRRDPLPRPARPRKGAAKKRKGPQGACHQCGTGPRRVRLQVPDWGGCLTGSPAMWVHSGNVRQYIPEEFRKAFQHRDRAL